MRLIAKYVHDFGAKLNLSPNLEAWTIASGDQLCLAISGESSQASRTLAIWFRNDTLPLISTQPYKLPTVSFILKQIVGYNRSSPDHAPDARTFGEFESY